MTTSIQKPAAHTDPPTPAATRVLIVGAVVLATLLIVGLILTVRGTTEYPEGSPEATAQAYLAELFDHDAEAARTYLAPELASQCRSGEPYSFWVWRTDAIRFEDVHVDGDQAEIDLASSSIDDFELFELPLDDGYGSFRDAEMVLERRDGTWLIVRAGIPLHGCNGR
jgi:hypothetical protein